MEEIKGSRCVGIDIIKAMAVIFVLCVHFSLNTNYYNTPITDINMVVQTGLRWLFYTGVPLFIMCTGYLNYQKTMTRSYYLKIFRVLIPFMLISILCLFLKKPDGSTHNGFQHAVFSILDFTADSYSWYVNMYIGLFLITPLLNVVLNVLDRKKVHVLLASFFFVIVLPASFNPLFVNFPALSYLYFPDWWQGFFPILYYFIGAYIAKYKIKVKKSICASTVFLLLCLQIELQILQNQRQLNNWFMSDYGSLLVVGESLGLFLLLYSSDVKSLLLKNLIKWISMLTLEIYLFSNITDSYIYSYFSSHYYGPEHPMPQQMIFQKYFYIIIPLTFLSSLVLSLVFHALYGFCGKILKTLAQKIGRKTPLRRKAFTVDH